MSRLTFDDFDNLELCIDCVTVVANGELPVNPDPTWDVADLETRWSEHRLMLTCGDDCEGWFSWSSCDGCGSILGGERHPAIALALPAHTPKEVTI